MSNPSGAPCPICLVVNDPDDMLAVEIPHATFPQSEPARFCRRCIMAIMQSAVASELIDPAEVFPAAPAPPEAPTVEPIDSLESRLEKAKGDPDA